MDSHSVTPSVNAPVHLTEKEWAEIRDCTSALFAVVGILVESAGRGEVGGIEALQSVERRLSLIVTLADNRISGKGPGECPLCGHTPSPNREADPPQGNPGDLPPPPQPVDPNKNGTHLNCPVCEE